MLVLKIATFVANLRTEYTGLTVGKNLIADHHMTSYYSEDNLVEQPTIALFEEQGWSSCNCYEESFGSSATLGRETPAEVVLRPKLFAALQSFNPSLSPQVYNLAIEELTRDRSLMTPVQANREIYLLLKNGVKVIFENDKGERVAETVKVIDWINSENNDFFLASQFWISGEMYKRRADLIGFVNGLPLVFIELKASHKKVKNAFKDNLKDYKTAISQLFWYNAFIILSNGSQSRIGSLTAEWEHFAEWKKITDEGEEGKISLETMLRGVCDKERLLDLVENFILFSETSAGTQKLVAKNHQFHGVNNVVNRLTATLTPSPSPRERGEDDHYRGGLYFSGLVERARELRQQQTPVEQILWGILRDRQFLSLKFRRQHQIGNYIADFYCHDKQLIVEIDGEIHAQPDVKEKDRKRDLSLTALGFNVLRLPNDLILNNPDQALQQIAASLGETNLPSPSGRGAGGEGKTPAPTRLGVFWHTQGSGKSYSMVFFSQKVLRKLTGNWTFLIVTDRQELDGQIYKNFANCGVVTEEEKSIHAQSAKHLQELLREDHRFVFTLIQKFRTDKGETYPKLSDRSDIIVITDEAHRSQYDVFALNMRNALPNAAFIGFTGTPLMAGEELTRKVFGEYVSIYNFKQSVDDKATVPLYYENRIPELQLTNENFNEEMEYLLEAAELDEAQERKLEREFAREYHLVTRDERLDKVAEDVVQHFTGRGERGKGMFIAIDKLTAVRMYEKVQAQWQREIVHLKDELTTARTEIKRKRLLEKITYMEETDMAVVVSQGQNELELFAEKGIDFKPHRLRMVKEDLEKQFKDAEHPFRLVFVCAMWITGFDVPCCNTIYLDKPMRNHTLMQTISRANRVFKDKLNGLIVDYVGVFRNMQKALAIYGSASGGDIPEEECPIKVKAFLVEKLRGKLIEAENFLKPLNISLEKMLAAEPWDYINLRDQAVEAILGSEESKRAYAGLANGVKRIYKAILPDPAANEFGPKRAVIVNIAEAIKSLEPEVDISEVLEQVEGLLDESIAAEGYIIRDPSVSEYGVLDISQIDFEALKKQFNKGKKRTELEKLKTALERKLLTLLTLNRSRMDYLERFQRLIDEYNNGARNVEEIFAALIKFAQDLNEEERRHVREEISEEELAVFDLLFRPPPELTEKERKQVKKVAGQLLEKLKQEKLVLDWRKKEMTRAAVRQTIDIILDELPEVYSKEYYDQRCEQVYQHIFDAYWGEKKGVYDLVH